MSRVQDIMKVIIGIGFFFMVGLSHGQNQWRWVHGDTINGNAVMGTKGVAHPNNFPGGDYEAAEWTDQEGNFWRMGGELGNDLWMYNPEANEWTWKHGENNAAAAVYGTKTVPDANNVPRGTKHTAVTWVDMENKLWLYGGSGNSDALWKYDPVTNRWTWMHGSQLINQRPVHGVKGVSAPDNTPGVRTENACGWVDKDNNLWMFGGSGFDANNVLGDFNDLWKYDVIKNEWTWVSGDSVVDVLANYGEKGVPAVTNNPGGRYIHSNWIDTEGKFWLFGGFISIDTIIGSKGDLWKYDPTTDLWTWMSGSDVLSDPGFYGEKCIPSPQNHPPARFENKADWIDDCNNLWTFGGSTIGWALDELGLNDLWRYNARSDEWVWVSGDSIGGQAPIFGTKGVATSTNKPGGTLGYSYWKNEAGFWLYGGELLDKGRDVMWNYVPDVATAAFSMQMASDVPGKVNFTNSSFSDCNEIKSYEWDFGVGETATDTSTAEHPSYTYTKDGVYDVKLVATTCTGSKDSVTHPVTIENLYDAIFIPNSFSPNGDGINDIYLPRLKGISADFRMLVFNRWGENIFETRDVEKGWDGLKKGKKAPLGIYQYVIEYTDYKGTKVEKKRKYLFDTLKVFLDKNCTTIYFPTFNPLQI